MTGTVSTFSPISRILNQIYIQRYVGDPVAIDWATQRIEMLNNI